MKYLEIPQAAIKISDNSKVTYCGKLYLLSYDYFVENEELKQGWILKSRQGDTDLILTESMIADIKPISDINKSNCNDNQQCCMCYVNMCNIDDIICQADRSFITVDTIVDRDCLNHKLLIDGKIVRVNKVINEDLKFEVKYYTWSASEQTWSEIKIGTDPDEYVDKTYLENNFAKISDITWTQLTGDGENGQDSI